MPPTIVRFEDRPEQVYPLHTDLRARELLGPGVGTGNDVTLFVARVAPGDGVAVTQHDVDETVYVAGGTAQLPDGTRLEAGTCVHLPAGTPHGLTNPGPGTLELELLIHGGRGGR
jgi:mannose-6-phosphate isomerase-like protein (cupin superfamily)